MPFGESDPLPPTPDGRSGTVHRPEAAATREAYGIRRKSSGPLPDLPVSKSGSQKSQPAGDGGFDANTNSSGSTKVRRGSSGPLPDPPTQSSRSSTAATSGGDREAVRVRRKSSGPLPEIPVNPNHPSYKHLDNPQKCEVTTSPLSGYCPLDHCDRPPSPEYAEPDLFTASYEGGYELPAEDDDDGTDAVVVVGEHARAGSTFHRGGQPLASRPPHAPTPVAVDGQYARFLPATGGAQAQGAAAVSGSTGPPVPESVVRPHPAGVAVTMGGSPQDEVLRAGVHSDSLERYENLPLPPQKLHQYENLEEAKKNAAIPK